MKTSHKLFLASAVALPFAGLAGTAVHAATDTTTNANPMSSVVSKISAKFNLKSEDVQAVFDEVHTAREAEMQTKVAEVLKEAGFTDAQITALQSKQKEQRTAMQTWRDANPNATGQERKTQRESERTAMESWAKDQGIDLTKVRDSLKDAGVGPMGGRGHGRHVMMDDGGTHPTDVSTNHRN